MNMLKRSERNQDGCAGYEQDLLLYLHSALTPQARNRVESHLKRCSACRKTLSTFTGASEMLALAIRGDNAPTWRPQSAGRSVLRRELPWYTPLIVAFFIGGAGVLWFYGDAYLSRFGRAEAAPSARFQGSGPVEENCIDPLACNAKHGTCMPDEEGNPAKLPSPPTRSLKSKAPTRN